MQTVVRNARSRGPYQAWDRRSTRARHRAAAPGRPVLPCAPCSTRRRHGREPRSEGRARTRVRPREAGQRIGDEFLVAQHADAFGHGGVHGAPGIEEAQCPPDVAVVAVPARIAGEIDRERHGIARLPFDVVRYQRDAQVTHQHDVARQRAGTMDARQRSTDGACCGSPAGAGATGERHDPCARR